MTVGELVEKLRKYPADMLVAIRDECAPDADSEYETIDIEHRIGDDEVIMVVR